MSGGVFMEVCTKVKMYDLTAREYEVLDLMVKGKSNPQIADLLFVSENTAKAHVGKVISKLKTSNRVEAVVKAIKEEIIKI